MHEIQVEITTTGPCPDMCPDGIHSFQMTRHLEDDAIARLLWGAALLYIPFFNTAQVSQFVLHQKGRTPVLLPCPDDPDDDPRICTYLGRESVMRHGDFLFPAFHV